MGKTPQTNFKLIFHLVVHAVLSMAELVGTWITWHFPVVPSVGTGCPLSAPAGSQGSVLGKGKRLARKEGVLGAPSFGNCSCRTPHVYPSWVCSPWRRPQGEAIAVSQYLKEADKNDGEKLFSRTCCEGEGGNGFN